MTYFEVVVATLNQASVTTVDKVSKLGLVLPGPTAVIHNHDVNTSSFRTVDFVPVKISTSLSIQTDILRWTLKCAPRTDINDSVTLLVIIIPLPVSSPLN